MTELERLRALPHQHADWEALASLIERAATRRTAVTVGRSRKILLERGELVVSERELADRWQWSRKRVQSFLADQQRRGQLLRTNLDAKKSGGGTKLTLVDFDTYAHNGTKRNQAGSRAKCLPARELERSPHQARNQAAPTTPRGGVVQRSLTTSTPSTPGAARGVADVENAGAGSRMLASDDRTAPGSEVAPRRSRDVQQALLQRLGASGVDARAEVRLPATSEASRSRFFFADVGVYRDGTLVALAECKTHQEVLGGYRQRTNYEGAGVPYRVATCETWCAVAAWLAEQVGGVALEDTGPPSAQLEIPPAENPEHLRYAQELADTLNRAQAENGRVDRDTYRPVAAHHRGTLAAALAIKNAGVPLPYATQYVWLEGQRYKPRPAAPQIASLAYLERGCVAAYHELRAKHAASIAEPAPRARNGKPQAIGELLADVVARAAAGDAHDGP